MADLTLRQLTLRAADLAPKEELLQNWSWLLEPHGVHLLCVSLMGDVFIAGSDERVHYLDTVRGTLEQVAATPKSFRQMAKERWFKDRYFHPRIVSRLLQLNRSLSSGQCFSYSLPLLMGGKDELANIEPTDVVMHLNLMGQLHQQNAANDIMRRQSAG